MNISNYYRNMIINHMLRGQAFSPAATVYIALFTANTGLQTNNPTGEVSASGYVRKAISLTEATTGTSSNSSDIEWDTAVAAWGTVYQVAIVDHETNTNWGTNVNVLMWNDLEESKTVNIGDIFRFSAGNVVVNYE